MNLKITCHVINNYSWMGWIRSHKNKLLQWECFCLNSHIRINKNKLIKVKDEVAVVGGYYGIHIQHQPHPLPEAAAAASWWLHIFVQGLLMWWMVALTVAYTYSNGQVWRVLSQSLGAWCLHSGVLKWTGSISSDGTLREGLYAVQAHSASQI